MRSFASSYLARGLSAAPTQSLQDSRWTSASALRAWRVLETLRQKTKPVNRSRNTDRITYGTL